jgi:hypothetical protein
MGVVAMSYTKGPWKQGRTLLTEQTLQWTEEQWNLNEAIENRMVFSNFSEIDRGISRVRVAICETRDDATLIAATQDLFEALEWIIKELPSNKDWLDPACEKFCNYALKKARVEM